MFLAGNAVRLVICNHVEDTVFRKSCIDHLLCLPNLEVWDASMVLPGQNVESEFETRMKTTHLVAFLISPQFLAHYDWKPITSRFQGMNRVLPVIIRSVLWTEHKELAVLQPLPSNRKPVSSWGNQDDAWLDIAKGISQIAKSFTTLSTSKDFVWNIKIQVKDVSPKLIRDVVLRVLDVLGLIAGDSNIEIERIDQGSVIITLISAEIIFKKIEMAFHNGILSKLVGFPVMSVASGDPKDPDRGGGAGGGGSWRWQSNNMHQVIRQKKV